MGNAEPSNSELKRRAEELESEHDWLGAAELYSKGLDGVSQGDDSKKVIFHQRLGYAKLRGAMLAETLDEFKNRIFEAVTQYQEAVNLGEGLSDTESRARNLGSRAMLAYLAYWLATTRGERRKSIEQAWTLAKESLAAFEEAGNGSEFGRTYNQLCTSAFLTVCFDPDHQSRLRALADAVRLGERAIDFLVAAGKTTPLVTAYVKAASYFCWLTDHLRNPEEKEKCLEKARTYWLEATKISEQLTILESASPESFSLDKALGAKDTVAVVARALECTRKARDKLALGTTHYYQACIDLNGLLYGTEDPDQRMRLATSALEHSQEASRNYCLVNFASPLGFLNNLWDQEPNAEYYRVLAQEVDADSASKRVHLRKGLDAAAAMLQRARSLGYLETVLAAHHLLSRLLLGVAKTETSPAVKQELLEKALAHQNRSLRIRRQVKPYQYFTHALQERSLAEVKEELANLATRPHSQVVLLQDALRHLEASVQLDKTILESLEARGWHYFIYTLGLWHQDLANLLARLHGLTQDPLYLRRTALVSEEASELFQKTGSNSRKAECQWKAAIAYDALSEYSRAEESFREASQNYRSAAESIPALKDYYLGYASYMGAWREIEGARASHFQRQYSDAGEHYKQASLLLASTNTWTGMRPLFDAYAKFEEAENLSSQERLEESADRFGEAERLFKKSEEILTEQLHVKTEERKLWRSIVTESQLGRKYSRARVILQEAMTLDNRGAYLAGAERLGQAAGAFRRLAEGVAGEQARKEFTFAALLCQAYQLMARAEELASPKLFLEASSLFEDSRAMALSENQAMVAAGNKNFCRALGTTTRLVNEGETKLRWQAIRDLDNAAVCYIAGGLQKASEYAETMKLLVDAYLYMRQAGKETDPEKKVRIFSQAEQILHATANKLAALGYQGKRSEVLRLVEKASRERDLAQSMVQVVQKPPVSPVRIPLITTPLDHAQHSQIFFEPPGPHVVSKVQSKRLTVGENFELLVEITNTGGGPIQILRLEKLLLQGLELEKWPEECSVKGQRVELRGKRLAPLRTQEVKLVMKPTSQGLFSLAPVVEYLDVAGRTCSQPSEPVDLVASPVLGFLIDCFANDYVKGHLAYQEAGWRGLMDIVKSLKLPRSQVYGDPRHGQSLAPRLEGLVRSGIVEFRIFSGQRGRGGQIGRVRACYEHDSIRRLVEGNTGEPRGVEVPAMHTDTYPQPQ